MAQLDTVIASLLEIEGASGAAIVDADSGMALAAGGSPGFDLNVAAAGNSNVVRAKLRTIADLELNDEIEDILITLKGQYHLINVLQGAGNAGLFIYLVLNRATANLALARHKLRAVAKDVNV
jgi:predicted regulator of Ras-like GTPase activity (Roadblock/LC7/MglB family)